MVARFSERNFRIQADREGLSDPSQPVVVPPRAATVGSQKKVKPTLVGQLPIALAWQRFRSPNCFVCEPLDGIPSDPLGVYRQGYRQVWLSLRGMVRNAPQRIYLMKKGNY